MHPSQYDQRRWIMVDTQIAGRGIRDARVLDAMREVPRERFVPEDARRRAYEDEPIAIAEGATVSSPYMVARMAEALGLTGTERVLEVGTGSGYAAAVLAALAKQVFSVERHPPLAEGARDRLGDLEVANVRVRCGDGSLGWPENAPYDAIVVAAGAPRVPRALLEQLAVGGRLVAPVGPAGEAQRLVRVTRTGPDAWTEEDLGEVRFVPLVGEHGHPSGEMDRRRPPPDDRALATLVREAAEPFADIESADLGSLLDRIGDARVVLLGESTHGTAEFYRMRARITRALIQRGFDIVAVEADWPDAAAVDRWTRGLDPGPTASKAFTRFPAWMWRNRETGEFLTWLRDHNATVADPDRRVTFCGLDLFSVHRSVDAVLRYLEAVDAGAAERARRAYACLTDWEGHPAWAKGWRPDCERQVGGVLGELLSREIELRAVDPAAWREAIGNARLVVAAERYHRVMIKGPAASWNVRDTHMFDTLARVMDARGPDARAVVWEHNSHVGDASATEMAWAGERNLGELARARWGSRAYLVGLGTHDGKVAAASAWDGPVEIKALRPAHPGSYERLCHDAGVPAFALHLREPSGPELRAALGKSRLERAIGVVYRPEHEPERHYLQASLPGQFDTWIWFDRTEAVAPLPGPASHQDPETWPFGV